MARFCNQYGKLIIGTLMALSSIPVYAEAVDLNMLIKGGTISGLETDVQVNCQGDLALNLETEAGLLFTTTECVPLEDGEIDFANLNEVSLGLQIDFTDSETNENFNFPARITNGEGPVGEGSTFNLVLGPFKEPDPVEPDPEDPPQDEEPIPDPGPQVVNFGEVTVEENDCAWARENDPGNGVFEPEECPNGPKIVIYDGSQGKDTDLPGCIASPSLLPSQCRGFDSIIGHTIYSQRFTMRDLGKAKELIGMFQATSINLMIGDSVSNLKNLIISVSENPGAFNNVSTGCKDVTASENSDVFITQSGSKLSQERPGKYCELTPGKTYYVNTRHEGGDSKNCGKSGTCQHTVVDRTVDPE